MARHRRFVAAFAACVALPIAAAQVSAQDRVDDEFLRKPRTTAEDPTDPAAERRAAQPSSGLSNDWVRDEHSPRPEDRPIPTIPRGKRGTGTGLEQAREQADENADEGLDRAVERAADADLEREERERDRPAFESSAQTSEDEGAEE